MRENLQELISERLSCERDKFVDFLKKAVSFDSSVADMGKHGSELGMQLFVREILENIGADVDVFEPDNSQLSQHPEANLGHEYANRPNVVGTVKGLGGGRSLMFNAHADVVPIGDENAWLYPPFEPQLIDGKLYGRGACDMKAGGMAALMALSILYECGIKLKGDVIFESVVDEEGGGNGTLACCLKGYHADAAIIPEPTELKLTPAHMGWLFYHITFHGKATHCATKWKGHNAVESCVNFINALQQLEREWTITKRHPYLPPPTICFTVMQGGVSSSTVPDLCKLDMSVHFHPSDTENGVIGSRIRDELFHKIANHINSDDWLRENPPEIELFQQGSGYDIGQDGPIVKCAKEALEQVLGFEPPIIGLATGADARLINNYTDTPTLICGPGSSHNAHSVNEFVELDQYFDAIRLYCNILTNWCGIA